MNIWQRRARSLATIGPRKTVRSATIAVLGTNQDNMLVPCNKCVDSDAVMEAWRTYVRENEELNALYGDYFEEEEGEEGEGEEEQKA